MKKIILGIALLGFLFFYGDIFAADICTNTCQEGEIQLEWPDCTCISDGGSNQGDGGEGGEGGEGTQSSDYGMTINTDCLLNGQCKMNVYKLIGIRTSDPNPTVLGFFQDITLASTTVFLGTVLVIAMIIGGLSRSFASITGKDTKKGKEILIASFVGMLLVMGSYAIIRLIQFLALAGS